MKGKIQKHRWLRGKNAYQNDYCMHCGLIFESDLGWTSADGVKCKEREIEEPDDLPDLVKNYISFNGFIFMPKDKVYVKPYSDRKYKIPELIKLVNEITTPYL